MKEWRRCIGFFSRLGMTLFFLGGSAICIAQVADIPQAELMQRIKTHQAGLILDVRSTYEYAAGHIPGAINIPHDQLAACLASTIKNIVNNQQITVAVRYNYAC